MCLILEQIGTAAATVGSKTVNADYNNITVTLDGKEVTLVDANGSAVEPFAINGTTYLPVRAIASALGLNVGWDQETTTVILNSSSSQATSGATTGTVILDKEGIKITFLGFEDLSESSLLKGWNINLKIENTTNKDYTVQIRNLSVNGMMADSIFSCDVTAGKTAVDSIWVYNLEDRGITPPVTTAEFYFHVFDLETWDAYFDSDVIKLQ